MLKKKLHSLIDEVMGEQAFQNIKDQINGQQETRRCLSDELDKLKQQLIELNEQIDAQEATLQVCHQDILAIENHYQDIKAEQSSLHVLIHHAIDHLNDEYQLTVERAKSESIRVMNRLTHYVKKLS